MRQFYSELIVEYDKLSTIMSPFLQLAFELVIILLAAKTAGYISTRLGQPSVLGELLIGVLLGPSLVNILGLPFINSITLGKTISELGEMGVLLLMFIAGLELRLDELTRNSKVSAFAGVLGVLTPVVLGWGTGWLFGFHQDAALFLGLTLAATSVSISAQTLIELKMLRTRIGLGLLGAAVFDDMLVLLLLSGFLAFFEGGAGLAGLLIIVLRMLLFLAASVAFGLWVLPRIVRLIGKLPISQGVLTLALVVMLTYGLAAELVGQMAAITGAFLAGLMFARSHEKKRIEHGVAAIAYGLFVPVFFVSIGLSVNLRELHIGVLWLTLVIIVVAIVSKFFGAGLGAKLAGFSWQESWQLGAGMISRGEVGLILANVGLGIGLVTQEEFSAIIGMVLISTLVTPPILRLAFARLKPKAMVPVIEEEKKK
jgi:Kef-type K+ transport system membrane component KefB